jgi:hypothetical protein
VAAESIGDGFESIGPFGGRASGVGFVSSMISNCDPTTDPTDN